METHNYKYSERLVAYIDIIGWTEATSSNDMAEKLKQTLKVLDDTKNDILVETIDVGLFSDGMLVTMALEHNAAIFSIGNICRELLAIGFLCRGGITKGNCYHKGNRVLGPAINKVVSLEKEAKMPRILIDNTVMELDWGYRGTRFSTIDSNNKNVLNLFPNFYPANTDIAGIERDLKISKIKEQIDENIKKFDGRTKKGKKWRYAKSLIEIQLNENVYSKHTNAND